LFAREVEPEIKQRYIDTGQVKLIWHDFPWIGDESRQAAQAARCAGAQGAERFWEYHDYLYHHQRGENLGQFASPNLKAFAVELGFDSARFDTCLDAGAELPGLRQAFQDGRQFGITGTPFFLIAGQRRVGTPTVQQLSAVLDAELARAHR
jgi:protein-disulfide isomerase